MEKTRTGLGPREIERDDFERYRVRYPGRRKRHHTWKYKLETFARLFGDRPALIQGDRILNWDQLNRACNRIAHGLESLGIRKGDRVAIAGFNSIEWMEAYLAASKLGAVPVNVNPRFVVDEIRYILEDSDARVLLVEEPYAREATEAARDLPYLKKVIIYAVGTSPSQLPPGALSLDEVITPDESNPRVDVYNDDFCFLMYTGGTTGYPKGTVWDGEQRVRGLDLMLLNNLLPIVERLPELSEGNLRGIASLFSSNPKTVDRITRILSSDTTRRFMRTNAFKRAFFEFFKLTTGNPYALKMVGAAQKEGVRFLCAAPLFHGAGYEGAFTYMGGVAATIVFLPTPHPFVAREFWETVERHRVHTAVIVGDAFALPLVEELHRAEAEGRSYDLSGLWALVSSGVRFSPHLKREILQRAPNCIIVDSMGLSESSGAFATLALSSEKEIKPAGASLRRSLSPGADLFPCRVYSRELGRDVIPGSGEVGEFLYGGYMALGYWKCPGKTSEDFRVLDGRRWFFSGDEGIVEADGRFRLIGRGGNYLINTGGEKVYSEEVEEVIKTHPAVYDAAVVGTPDPRWGEVVTALVELREGKTASPEEIKRHCREHLAAYKCPKHVFFVEKVPRAASGKIDRFLAREMLSRMKGSVPGS